METIKSAGYVRVSTTQQVDTGTSIDDQIEKINKEAKSRGWGNPVIYKDEGISGKSSKRPSLQKLLEDIKIEKYHAIIFTKLDRLARNLRDLLNFYHEAERYGAKLICLDNPAISTEGPMGNIILQILGAFAQFERDLIRSRTVSGRMIKWKNGEAFMGRLPFGYNFNKESQSIEIDEFKKSIVEKIYSYYINKRMSMIDIANYLTNNGIPTPSTISKRKDASPKWNSTSVREILKNISYTGEKIEYNKYKYKWNENKIFKSNELKDKTEWISIILPKIIDKETFEHAQSIIDSNKTIPKKKHKGYENKFIAENVLKCGHCHAKISKQTSGSRKFIYYTCPWRRASQKQLNAKNQQKCHLPFLDSDKIDIAVYDQITDLLSNPKEYAKEWLKDKPTDELQKKIQSLEELKNTLQTKLKKAIKMEINSSNNDLTEIYSAEREKIETDYNNISKQLTISKNELDFHENKILKLKQFQSIFAHEKKEHSMRMKITLKKMLNRLTNEEKKKLINAVISPETGGCVYVRELTTQDLGLTQDQHAPTSTPHGNKVEERNFVIELDFTLEPTRIIGIIQAMDKTFFKVGEQ
ncbi:MAG: recombinase family protein [Clostridia bacterium]|nr:recombinase family protein [Clostridia bacterium]